MPDVIASPSVRAHARQKGIDLEQLASNLGRQSIAREDLEAASSAPAAAGDVSYWDVNHSQFGPVSEEPMSRFAQVAAANMAAAQALIPAVTHHDRADMSAVEAFRSKSGLQTTGGEHKVTLNAQQLAELSTELEALRALVYRATELYVSGKDVTKLASMAKLKAGRLVREVNDWCIQFHGGMGYMMETPIVRAYRDGRILAIGGGADEVMLGIICKLMDTLPKRKR